MRALLIEDNPDMRFLVRTLMGVSDEPVEIVAEADDGPDGVARWREHRPDVVVLDLGLPSGNGLDFAVEILAEDPEQQIVLFSAFLSDNSIVRAIELGITCLSKDELRRLPALVAERATH